MRLEPKFPDPHAGRDVALEGLRGFAALVVFYAHLTAPFPKVDPVYAPSPQWWRFEFAAGAVLLFFVLSGYVIGLTNLHPATAPLVRAFWWRRFWRLFPINALAVGLAWLALPGTPAKALWGNLLFLQNSQPLLGLQVPLLETNPNLWSLHYEMIYYLLFPIVWSLRPRSAVLVSGLLVAAGLRLGLPGVAVLSNLAAGALFWLAGLWLAWREKPDDATRRPAPWPSALLLFVVTCKLHVAVTFAQRLGLNFVWSPQVNLWDLDLLPVAILLVASVAGRSVPFPRFCPSLAIGIPALRIGWQMCSQHGWPLPDSQLYAAGWLLAVLLWPWRPDRSAWRLLAPVGAISYALYALAAPLQYCIHDLQWLPSGTVQSYVLRLVVTIIVAFICAWLAEAKLQPLIVSRVRRSP